MDKAIRMIVTIINGHISNILHLLYWLLIEWIELDNQNDHASGHFIKEYGVMASVYNISAHSRIFKRKLQKCQESGVSPPVYSRFLLENAVFLMQLNKSG